MSRCHLYLYVFVFVGLILSGSTITAPLPAVLRPPQNFAEYRAKLDFSKARDILPNGFPEKVILIATFRAKGTYRTRKMATSIKRVPPPSSEDGYTDEGFFCRHELDFGYGELQYKLVDADTQKAYKTYEYKKITLKHLVHTPTMLEKEDLDCTPPLVSGQMELVGTCFYDKYIKLDIGNKRVIYITPFYNGISIGGEISAIADTFRLDKLEARPFSRLTSWQIYSRNPRMPKFKYGFNLVPIRKYKGR